MHKKNFLFSFWHKFQEFCKLQVDQLPTLILDLILKKSIKKCVDWSKISKQDYMNAMKLSPTKSNVLKSLLEKALTTKINDREMFMKGIDYSYYYEENNEWKMAKN